nr:hypothetical protein [uncultured Chitinophaga sp.]
MKKLFFLIPLIFFFCLDLYGQKLHLQTIINDAYRGQQLADTLYFIKPAGVSCIEAQSGTDTGRICIRMFRNEQELTRQLPDTNYICLLSLAITDIGPGKLKLNLAVSKTNRRLFVSKYRFEIFYDERMIECVYSPERMQWEYNETISIKKHLTD